MEREEKSANKDQYTNQKYSYKDCPDTHDNNGTLGEKSLHTSSNCPEAKPDKGLVFFYLLASIIIMAFYYTGAVWSVITEMDYPSSFGMHECFILASILIFSSAVSISPLFILLAVWRGFYGLPFARMTKIICSIISFSIWATIFTLYFYDEPMGQSLKQFIEKYEPISVMGVALFLAEMIKACIAILGYEKSKHSVGIDVTSSTVLCVAYYIFFYYLIR